MTRKPAVLMLALSLAVLALALIPAAGLAVKGGNGGGGGGGGGKPGGGGGSSATVTASPNPAAAYGTVVEVNGCGYDMYQPAEVRVVHSVGYTEAVMAAVWNPGCLHPTAFRTAEPGTYTIEVYQSSRQGSVLKASTVLTVL